jgi:hypothetical protein
LHDSDASRRENADLYLLVIARSKATKQSIVTIVPAVDCFASLAMTVSRRSILSVVVARLDRAIQYSRDACDGIDKPRRTGYPVARGMTLFMEQRKRAFANP